jgi:predicted small lipoprotein YifL
MTARRTSRTTLRCLLLSLLLGLGAASCGQRGPLYLPETEPGAAGPVAASPQDAPAAQSARDEEEDEETP